MAKFADFIKTFIAKFKTNNATSAVPEPTPASIETIANEFPNVDANNYKTVSDKMYTILYSSNGVTKAQVESTARESLDL
jgi:hypothetical protein